MTTEKSKTEQFKPWIGEHYGASGKFGKRVMILGESHYEWLDGQTLTANWTREFIENGIKGKQHKFRSRIEATFLGRPPLSTAEAEEFWHSVAYMNYIPVSVGKGASARPTEEMWAAAVPRFAALIEEHTPRLLVVLGRPLWRRMHFSFEMDGRLERHSDDPGEHRIWRYRYNNGETMLTCAIKHPSRAFNATKWHPFVSAMLEAA